MCDQGWKGRACELPECPKDCSAHGSCVAPGACSCAAGWSGAACEAAVCSGGCSGHGTCDAPGVCRCDAGWGGFDCSEPLCAEACHEHGECIAPGVCSCVVGWAGDSCEHRESELLQSDSKATELLATRCLHNCSGAERGACDDSGRCRCKAGWRGVDCALPACAGLRGCHESSKQGLCIAPGVCECNVGWEVRAAAASRLAHPCRSRLCPL